MADFEYLDFLAQSVARGDDSDFGTLSSAEKVYVAMAANRHDLLTQGGYNIVQAIARLGPTWLDELLLRHRY